MFAARCRAWAQGAFARQQGREYDPARCFVEGAQPCRRGDKVMIMSGSQQGCMGSVSRLMKRDVLVSLNYAPSDPQSAEHAASGRALGSSALLPRDSVRIQECAPRNAAPVCSVQYLLSLA